MLNFKGENEYSYPAYTETQAKELIDCLREITPFVVIDCGSYIANDILSAVALMEADGVLRLANADLMAVVTTIHSNSCEATYRRMVSLCKRAVDMSDKTLMDYVTEAYPIIVFCKQLGNRERKLMEIMECEILPNGERNYRTLYRYTVEENRVEDGRIIISGYHEQIEAISDSLARRFLENGMPSIPSAS